MNRRNVKDEREVEVPGRGKKK